jgi:hypothetical protein
MIVLDFVKGFGISLCSQAIAGVYTEMEGEHP